jgi:hypothetical protein
VMRKYHAGFGREGACFLPDAIRAWQRTLTSAEERPRAGVRGRDHSAARSSHPRQAVRQARGQLQLELHLHVRPVQQPADGREALHARLRQDEEGPGPDLPGADRVGPGPQLAAPREDEACLPLFRLADIIDSYLNIFFGPLRRCPSPLHCALSTS